MAAYNLVRMRILEIVSVDYQAAVEVCCLQSGFSGIRVTESNPPIHHDHQALCVNRTAPKSGPTAIACSELSTCHQSPCCSAPKPTFEANPPDQACLARGGCREPRQFTARAILRQGGTCAYAAQPARLNACADRLADGMGYRGAVAVIGISRRQTRRRDAPPGMTIADRLMPRERRLDQYRPGVVAQILRFIRPALDKPPQVESRGHRVFAEVERAKAVWRIPAPAQAHGKRRVQRIRPRRIGNSPPRVAIGQQLADQRHRLLADATEVEHLAACLEHGRTPVNCQEFEQRGIAMCRDRSAYNRWDAVTL